MSQLGVNVEVNVEGFVDAMPRCGMRYEKTIK